MDLVLESKKIVKFIRKNLVDEEGILIIGTDEEGKKMSHRIVDDFGDVAPFVALYGGEDICSTHLEYLSHNFKSLNFDRAFYYTDLLLGLAWYARIGVKKEEAKVVLQAIAKHVRDICCSKGKIKSVIFNSVSIPVTYGIDSTYIEVWTEIYRSTNDKSFLETAIMTADYFVTLQKKSKNKLLPMYSFPLFFDALIKLTSKKRNACKVMKDNTNFGFGLLDIFRLTGETKYKDAFDDLFASIDKLIRDERLHNFHPPKDGVYQELLPAFACIDLFCDAYILFKDEKYLISAERLSVYWIDYISDRTGLLPMTNKVSNSYLDSETDMAVSLLKLYEITNNNDYKDIASRIIEGILKHHKSVDGAYLLSIDINTEEIVHGGIKTKFMALAIKGFHILMNAGQIYKNDDLFMLAKDR